MERTLFDDDHELFRRSVADWITADVVPHDEAVPPTTIPPTTLPDDVFWQAA